MPEARVGLLGGTFDPVHLAHVALAQAALQALQLDQVRWIPAGQPWQKAREVTAAHHRVAMVRLAIAGEPRFVLDRIELERGGPSQRQVCVVHRVEGAAEQAHPGGELRHQPSPAEAESRCTAALLHCRRAASSRSATSRSAACSSGCFRCSHRHADRSGCRGPRPG